VSWISLAAALLLLNASLTFRNVWPTPGIWWAGDLSVELAVCLLLLLGFGRGRRPVGRRALAALTAVWVVFVFGRYADVTTPALLGRPINLFWDVRYARDVAAMFVRAAPWWGVALAVAALAAAIVTLYRLLRGALARAARGGADPRERRALAALAIGLLAFFVFERSTAQPVEDYGPEPFRAFATPVTQTYVRQARLVVEALDPASKTLAPTPPLDSDLSLVQGADVVLMFMESYGAVTWQRPDLAARLAQPRRQLAADIEASRREVVSGYVESPTYGGSSWLAHISLLSGVEIRDPDANALLMSQRRDTLVGLFARHGYKTVALMPGMWSPWPEGSFYGFQDMYGGERLAYKGPEFGWWALPDQFTIARLDALEVAPSSRPPLFVFFPTVSTHAPFTPTAPYQPDWARMLTKSPFDEADVNAAFDNQPDWTNLSPSYGNAVAYAYQVLGGYLRQRAGHDFVLIVLGDHQPPALVSGAGQPWDVPVHVIASRGELLDRLRGSGFHAGLDPSGPRVAKMHELLPILLHAFGDRP
jgi:hypothetical protein